jgi:hypothetical protein
LRLDPELVELVECYARFIHSGQNYVIEKSLRYTFSKDRDFQQWLTNNRTTGEKAKEGHRSEKSQPGGRCAPQDR